jgi:hypothetical protein
MLVSILFYFLKNAVFQKTLQKLLQLSDYYFLSF